MLTKRQNLMETIRGGNPDRFVNQYEPFAISFAENLGIAFQIVDDVLDFLEGEDNSDIVSGKSYNNFSNQKGYLAGNTDLFYEFVKAMRGSVEKGCYFQNASSSINYCECHLIGFFFGF